MCRVPQPDGDGEDWYSFNDESVVRVSPSQVRTAGLCSVCWLACLLYKWGTGTASMMRSSGGARPSQVRGFSSGCPCACAPCCPASNVWH